MKIKLLFFAALRERMKTCDKIVETSGGETAAALAERVTGIKDCLAYAVNDELVKPDYILSEGDTLALIPPMAGG